MNWSYMCVYLHRSVNVFLSTRVQKHCVFGELGKNPLCLAAYLGNLLSLRCVRICFFLFVTLLLVPVMRQGKKWTMAEHMAPPCFIPSRHSKPKAPRVYLWRLYLWIPDWLRRQAVLTRFVRTGCKDASSSADRSYYKPEYTDLQATIDSGPLSTGNLWQGQAVVVAIAISHDPLRYSKVGCMRATWCQRMHNHFC